MKTIQECGVKFVVETSSMIRGASKLLIAKLADVSAFCGGTDRRGQNFQFEVAEFGDDAAVRAALGADVVYEIELRMAEGDKTPFECERLAEMLRAKMEAASVKENFDRWLEDQSKDKKRPRLFVKSPGTDDCWAYCGGPTLEEAMRGLMNCLQPDVEEILHYNRSEISGEFAIEMRELSDNEIEALPEM